MPKNALIIGLFLLSFLSAKAQYLGGSGDGYAMGETRNVALGTDEVALHTPYVNVYPNPSKVGSGFTVNFRSAALWNWIEIYDVMGKLKYKAIAARSGNMRINLSENGFKSGVYFLNVRSSTGRSAQRKIVLTD